MLARTPYSRPASNASNNFHSSRSNLRNTNPNPLQRFHQTPHQHAGQRLSNGGNGGSAGGINTGVKSRPLSAMKSPSSRKQRHSDAAIHGGGGHNFKVVIRVRPPLPRELGAQNGSADVSFNGIMGQQKPRNFYQNVVQLNSSTEISLSENFDDVDSVGNRLHPCHTFTFDHVYDMQATQKFVYETTAQAVVSSALFGYNATIFAYGQTGTGKTYTMEGFDSAGGRGIIPRAIEQIFHHIQGTASPTLRFLVRCSYLQIYNEVISDLLKPELTNLLIREDKKRGVFVEGLSEWVVRSPKEIYGLMERGGSVRATGSHKLNELSSRSHAVFIIICEQSQSCYVAEDGHEMSPAEYERYLKENGGISPPTSSGRNQNGGPRLKQSFKVGKLNLVDLAGSERVRMTGATGQRLEETKKINQSLSALGNVIAALTDPKGRAHIPYRDSKLTRILEDSLGGNCKTTMMAMISPALEAFSESLSTLKFANRAKNIKNEARINEDLDQRSLIRKYERELKQLRTELQTRNQNVVDKRQLLEVDEMRRQAEQDKLTALRALEARSIEMMKEKSEKRKLEHRISALSSQMLAGGAGAFAVDENGNPVKLEYLHQTPAFRNAVAAQHNEIRAKYEDKLADLEQERHSIEQEKAEQVGRSKELLQKQRNIMVALTERLNERDEQIIELQEELDAYDRRQKELEERLDAKTAQLIHLQRVTMEHNESSPYKSKDLEKAALGRDHWLDIIGEEAGSAAGGGGDEGNQRGSLATQLDSAAGDTDGSGSIHQQLKQTLAEKAELEKMLQVYMGERVQATPRNGGHRHFPSDVSEPSFAQAAELARTQNELAKARQRISDLSNDFKQYQDRMEEKVRRNAHRQASISPSSATVAALQQKVADLTQRLQEKNKDGLGGSSASGSGGATAQEAALLRERCATHVKERRAVLTIMEQKIKKLVANAGQEARNIVVPPSAGGQTAPTPLLETPAGQRLSRELKTLARLVNASIAALKNSSRQ